MSNPILKYFHEIDCAKLAANGQDLLTVNINDPIESVVKKLRSRNVLSAPVLNDDNTVAGVIDLQQLVTFLSSSFGPYANEQTVERNLRMRCVKDVLSMATRTTYVPVDVTDKCTLAIELFASGFYRAPITTHDNHLVGLITQVDIVMEAAASMRTGAAKAMGQRLLSEYGVGLSAPSFVNKTQTVGDTIAQLDAYQVSGLPVTDDNGHLIGNFSITNLLSIWADNANESISLTVEAFLAKYSPESLRPKTARRDEKLVDVVSRLVEQQIHRAWIVDKDNKPVGVISMTDICKIIRDHTEAAETGATTRAPREPFGCVFRTFDGKSIGIKDGKIALLSDANSADAVWKVHHLPIGTQVTLQASNGKYLSVDSKHHLSLSDAATPDTHILLISSETGAIALHDAAGGFLEPHGDTLMSRAQQSTQALKKQWFKMHETFVNKKLKK